MTPLVSATVDSGALRHNLQIVRQWAPKSRVMAVIKANGYGHGLIAVARALDTADAFAVARVDEGLVLREAGINNPIVLLEGVFDREQLDAAAAAGFELVVPPRNWRCSRLLHRRCPASAAWRIPPPC
jgi:alanine racemase